MMGVFDEDKLLRDLCFRYYLSTKRLDDMIMRMKTITDAETSATETRSLAESISEELLVIKLNICQEVGMIWNEYRKKPF